MDTKNKPEERLRSKEKTSVIAFIHSILNEAAEFKGWQFIFQVLLFTFVIWAAYNLKILYEFHNSLEYAHIPKYSVYDLKYSLILVTVFLGYKNASQVVFRNFIKNSLDPKKFPTEEDKEKRAKITTVWLSNMIYYTFSSVTCFLLFRDQDFWPKLLGGKGDVSNAFKALPGQIPYGQEFYMVQFACHLHSLIDYVVYKWRDHTFWEMFLHHSLAVFLVFFSYCTNNIAIGILVLFVHDPCDVWLYIIRLLSDSKYKSIAAKGLGYVVFIYVWAYLRLFAFPRCIIKGCFDFISSADAGILYSPYLFMALMLTALLVLHFYWFVFIIRIMFALFRGKSNWNVYDNKKKKEEETATTAASSS